MAGTFKAKAPRQFKLGPYTYKLEISDEIGWRGARGEHIVELHLIRIDAGTPLKTEAFLHEYIHAVDFIYGDYDLTESQAKALAKGFLDLLNLLHIQLDWGK